MSTISHTTFFTINPETAYTLIDNEAVIMGAKDEQLFGSNDSATELWQLLEKKPLTIPMMQAYLMEHFEVDADVCLRDVESLMAQLLEEKLVMATDTVC